MTARTSLLLALISAFSFGTAHAQTWGIRPPTFGETIRQVTALPSNQGAQRLAAQHGLNVVNVMWEDTGRNAGSSVGPNISDITLQVREPIAGGGVRTHLLPVIRHPNFSDRTADVRANHMWVRVGNQREGEGLRNVPLREVLSHLRAYLSDPSSLQGEDDFSAPRDTHYLVSAQHVFVPIQAVGQAEFNPVIYNYQSYPESPAVMTLLVTRQGTSATIVDNRRGDQSLQGWGQQLFFNHAGQRTTFTAERRSAVQARIESGETSSQDVGALEEGADMMMLIQVPLRQRNPRRQMQMEMEMNIPSAPMMGGAPTSASRSSGRSDVERAVIGHGEDMGVFREMGNMRLVRDERFPVRVTVQFYRATSNGVISAEDMADVRRSIDRVYEDGEFVGSLVVPRGERTRPTDWIRTRRRFLRRHSALTPAFHLPVPAAFEHFAALTTY
ncbi:MAG: hypothetical protein AB8H86_11335 [Polyangiales bacterium]